MIEDYYDRTCLVARADSLPPADRALYDAIAQHDRQQQFLSIYSYDPDSARRYHRFCCGQQDYTPQDDLELILKAIPDENWEAVTMGQLRQRLERLDPYYNKGALSRNLERLCQSGQIQRYAKKQYYIYWKGAGSF